MEKLLAAFRLKKKMVCRKYGKVLNLLYRNLYRLCRWRVDRFMLGRSLEGLAEGKGEGKEKWSANGSH